MRVLDRGELRTQLGRWQVERKVSVDVETNGIPPWEPNGRIVGIALAGLDQRLGRPTAVYVPLAHQIGANADPLIVGDIIETLSHVPLIGFSTAHEVMWALAKWGARLRFAGDPYIIARLLTLQQFGLKDLVEAVLKRPALRIEDVLPVAAHHDFSLADSDDAMTTEYAAADALHTWQLEAALLPQVLEHRLQGVYQVELHAAGFMGQQTLLGYEVDAEVLDTEMDVERARVVALQRRIQSELGGKKPVNLNSSAQLGAALQKLGVKSETKTPAGNPSWSKDALEVVADQHPVIPMVIEHKSVSAVLAAMDRVAGLTGGDGRLHPRWQSIGLWGSARMYAERPPLTAFPRRAHRAFRAPDGYRWVQMAWDHAELRFAAAATRDEALAKCFAADDFHDALRNATGFTDANEVLDVRLQSYLHGGVREQDEWAVRLGATFPLLKTRLIEVEQTAAQTRQVTSWMNRRWRLQGDDPEVLARRGSISLVQQSVATALKVSLTLLHANIEMGVMALRGTRQVLPVFDVVNYCVPLDTPLEANVSMMARLFGLSLGEVGDTPLHLVCHFAAGPSWGELEPVVLAVEEEEEEEVS